MMFRWNALLTLTFAFSAATAVAQEIRVGERYPDFVLPRIDNGEPVSSGSLLGKPAVLIHFASW